VIGDFASDDRSHSMNRFAHFSLFGVPVLVVMFLAACASPAGNGSVERASPDPVAVLKPVPIPNVSLGEIIALSKAGTPPDTIIKELQDTGTVHNLNAQLIIDLNRQGVDQSVINYLADAQEKARQAAVLAQLAERDAKAARDLELERNRQRELARQPRWSFGIGSGWGWGPSAGFGWGIGAPY
jgi:hypothetical protein